jgi:hypothetical protein
MSIKIHDIRLEVEDLTTAQIEKVNGGDNPGMAPDGAYQYGVSGGNCSGAGPGGGLSMRNCVRSLFNNSSEEGLTRIEA